MYLYDDIEDCVKEKLKFTIPSWVILHTLTMLEEKKLKEDAQKATEMEKDISSMQSLEKLYEDMSQETPERKSTQSLENESSPEQKQPEVAVEAPKRKVSIVPLLKQITEEENIMISKDEKIKILEMKVHALLSSLQDIQELISAINESETPMEVTEF